MHGPDGTDYLNENQYLEIVKPERLVYLTAPSRNFKRRSRLRTTTAKPA